MVNGKDIPISWRHVLRKEYTPKNETHFLSVNK